MQMNDSHMHSKNMHVTPLIKQKLFLSEHAISTYIYTVHTVGTVHAERQCHTSFLIHLWSPVYFPDDTHLEVVVLTFTLNTKPSILS